MGKRTSPVVIVFCEQAVRPMRAGKGGVKGEGEVKSSVNIVAPSVL